MWVVKDAATSLVLANHLIDHARSQGYRCTATVGATARMLAPNLAELTGTFVRFNAEEGKIARFGFTYVVRLVDGVWKFVVALAHEPLPGA